jgi:hypothetical protein
MLVALVLGAGAPQLFSSCDPAELKHPLSDPAQSKPDAKLLGNWAGRVGETESLVSFSTRKDDNLMDVVVLARSDEGLMTLAYQASTSTVGGKTYLNLKSKHFTDALENKYELSPNYILVRYEFGKDGSLSLAYLVDEEVKKAIEAGTLHGEVGKTIVLDDDVPALTTFLAKADDKTFGPFGGAFKKTKIDFGKPPPKGK